MQESCYLIPVKHENVKQIFILLTPGRMTLKGLQNTVEVFKLLKLIKIKSTLLAPEVETIINFQYYMKPPGFEAALYACVLGCAARL